MNDQQIQEQISNKLSALIAISLQEDTKKMSVANGERLLRRFGLDNQSIADILGTTKRTIEVMKSRDQKGRR